MKSSEQFDVVVIGGGPAGMMAAGRAAERGRNVLLLEKNSTLGKKLLITGGGRCNVTNNKPEIRTMLAQYKKSDKFLFSAFSQFGVVETLKFFNDRGMATKEEAEGRIFPVSDKSKSVLDVLVQYMKDGGVEVCADSSVAGITFEEAAGQMIIALGDGSKIFAQSCIVATGGVSHPETGSTGEGFQWLQTLGHQIIKNDMALVPIAIKDSWVGSLAGLTLNDIKLTTFKNDIRQKSYSGRLLFTHVGISGPSVLNMSREVGELLHDLEGSAYAKSIVNDVVITLDLFPHEDVGVLRKRVQAVLIEQSNKKLKNSLSELIAPALVDTILMLSRIDGETPNHSVRTEERKALVSMLKSVPMNVAGLLGKEKAIVSSGGVALKEIDFKTMQSRLIPALYLVGDVLDVDRPSGGYSLQLCWTTGYVAGSNC